MNIWAMTLVELWQRGEIKNQRSKTTERPWAGLSFFFFFLFVLVLSQKAQKYLKHLTYRLRFQTHSPKLRRQQKVTHYDNTLIWI